MTEPIDQYRRRFLGGLAQVAAAGGAVAAGGAAVVAGAASGGAAPAWGGSTLREMLGDLAALSPDRASSRPR